MCYPACWVLNVTDEPDKTDSDGKALTDLDARLNAIDARKRQVKDKPAEVGMNAGYKALGSLFGGILVGLGLGWVIDHYVHTTPWGMIVGCLLGLVAAVYSVVKSAQDRP